MTEETREETKRVVIELPESDYDTLKIIKGLAKMDWRDLLIYGALKLVDDFGGEDKFIDMVKTILERAKKITEE